MIPLTQNSLDKLELLLKELGYKLRYEQGAFKTGSCIILNSKVIVVNKFSKVDMKVRSLMQILQTIPSNEDVMSEKNKIFFRNIKQSKITI